MNEVRDYPKTKCVFEREGGRRKRLVTPTVLEGMEWVFEDGVRAVDKIDGSGHCVILDANGDLLSIDNRKHRIFDGKVSKDKQSCEALSGYLNAVDRGWLKAFTSDRAERMEHEISSDSIDYGILMPETGNVRIYGEMVGPKIQDNMHGVDKTYFVPFDMLYARCHWNSWLEGRYPKTFESLSDWFKELPSLFSKRYMKKDVLAEGLIFRHPDGRCAKLRRNMFDWYKKETS